MKQAEDELCLLTNRFINFINSHCPESVSYFTNNPEDVEDSPLDGGCGIDVEDEPIENGMELENDCMDGGCGMDMGDEPMDNGMNVEEGNQEDNQQQANSPDDVRLSY